MIAEEQARDAASRLAMCATITRDANDDRRPEVAVYGCDTVEQARHLCQEDCLALAAYFAQRDAERIERAKPIDVEWCVINGGRLSRDKQHVSWAIDDDGAEVWWNQHTGVVSVELGYYIIYPHAIQSRGQLLDLLAAMKGGAS